MGTFGDTIYSLCLVKALGGGNMYVKLNALDTFARDVLGWPNAGPASGRLTKKDYEMLAPLLEAQNYLNKVSIWNGEETDYNNLQDHWKYHLIKGWQGNQTECYALALGMNIHDTDLKKKLLYEPWLTPVEPLRVPGKPFVVNRTERYLHGRDHQQTGWEEWINNGLSDYSIFLGTEEEHYKFENFFKIKIQYQKTNDLLEMARYIQGCEQFIGNQSAGLSIAIGLGKTYWCEIIANYEQTKTPHGGYGDTWFPRINGFYF
jgi:hypothetical protein